MSAPTYVTVLAPSFHGATTLAALLNNHPSIVSLGDTNPPRRFEHHACTCGAEIRACEFWTGLRAAMRVYEQAGSPAWFPSQPLLVGGRGRFDGHLAIGAGLLDGSGALEACLGRLGPFRRFRAYLDTFATHVLAASGKSVFVDGEKSLTKHLGGLIAGHRPHAIIHLVRDPRAFVASSIRAGSSARRAMRDWRAHHGRVLHLTRRHGGAPVLRLRYEDLTAAPEATMRGVMAFLGVPYADLFFRPPPGAFWHQTGNRTILRFDGRVRESERWRTELRPEEAEATLVTAGSLARELGYGSAG